MDPSKTDAWAHHVAGSTRLMKYQSPRAFKNEFENTLFHSHVGPVVSEALHNNTYCVLLAGPKWTALYESLTANTEELTERHELVINARKLISPLPGLWHDVRKTLTMQHEIEDQTLLQLNGRCQTLHSQYLAWREMYKEYCASRSLSVPTEQEMFVRRETYGQALESLLIVKLLLGTVTADAKAMAEKIQALAMDIMELQKQPGPRYLGSSRERKWVAEATSDNFLENLSELDVEERVIGMRKRYMSWSGMLRGC
ncbi:hypothetical protein BST61_g11508 [Cercospora zeina]